jgi:hypothetical protein
MWGRPYVAGMRRSAIAAAAAKICSVRHRSCYGNLLPRSGQHSDTGIEPKRIRTSSAALRRLSTHSRSIVMNIRFSFNPDQNSPSLARCIRPFVVTAALAASVAPPFVSAQATDRSSAVTTAEQPYPAAFGQANGGVAPEGSYPEQAAPGSGRTRAEVRTETARWIAAGRPGVRCQLLFPVASIRFAGSCSLGLRRIRSVTASFSL